MYPQFLRKRQQRPLMITSRYIQERDLRIQSTRFDKKKKHSSHILVKLKDKSLKKHQIFMVIRRSILESNNNFETISSIKIKILRA